MKYEHFNITLVKNINGHFLLFSASKAGGLSLFTYPSFWTPDCSSILTTIMMNTMDACLIKGLLCNGIGELIYSIHCTVCKSLWLKVKNNLQGGIFNTLSFLTLHKPISFVLRVWFQTLIGKQFIYLPFFILMDFALSARLPI